MIYKSCATFGHKVRPRNCLKRYFEPLAIYAMYFRSFPGSHDAYRHFSMFLVDFRCFITYIMLIATSTDYLCVRHTIVYLIDVFPAFSDLLLALFIFALIDIP